MTECHSTLFGKTDRYKRFQLSVVLCGLGASLLPDSPIKTVWLRDTVTGIKFDKLLCVDSD